MSDIRQGIEGLEEPSRSIGKLLIDFYERMKVLEKDPERGGKQATLIVMTVNDMKEISNPEPDEVNMPVYEPLYYIQNEDAGYLGNAIIFWAQDSHGYTPNLDKSHKFTKEEAKRICLGNPDKNKAWPVDYIDGNNGIQRIVDSQYLEHDNIRKFRKTTPNAQ